MDEQSDLSGITPINGMLRFNLKSLEHVNSIGIRCWVTALDHHGDATFEFYDCPDTFLEAASIFDHILGPNRDPKSIKSGEIHYICDQCDHEFSHMHRLEEILSEEKRDALKVPCPNCKEAVPLDSEESSYVMLLEDSQ